MPSIARLSDDCTSIRTACTCHVCTVHEQASFELPLVALISDLV